MAAVQNWYIIIALELLYAQRSTIKAECTCLLLQYIYIYIYPLLEAKVLLGILHPYIAS